MPARGHFLRRASWALLGLAASVPLHVVGLSIAMLLTVALGLAPNSTWPQRTQYLFVLSFPLWQWAYLLPAVLFLRRRRPAMAAGLGASAVIGVLFALAGLLSVVHGM